MYKENRRIAYVIDGGLNLHRTGKAILVLSIVIIIIAVVLINVLDNNKERRAEITQLNITMVTHGKPMNTDAGEPFQFPEAGRTVDGLVYVTCSGIEHKDSTQGYETERLCFVSSDEGSTWQQKAASELVKADIRLPNGNYFQGAVPQNSYDNDMEAYSPVFIDDNVSLFFARDIPGYKKTITFREYDPKTERFIEFEGDIDWEYMPVVVTDGQTLTLNATAYLSQFYQYKDTLYMVMYSKGFDSENGGGAEWAI